jgi:hypothetical protein
MNNIKTETERRSRHAEGGDPHHYPYARHVRTGWKQDADGAWSHEGEDAHLWEVFCAECGDTDGPAQLQSPEVQTLRGPYQGEHRAKHAATRHFKLT